MSDRKRYRDLPELGSLGMKHSRGELPVELGTLSRIGPSQVKSAAGMVTEGVTVPLNLQLDAFDPPLFGRLPLKHTLLRPARNEVEDLIDSFNPQASSQLDGLAHVLAREHGFFDGSTDLETARENIGIHHWAKRGIAGRAVLLDMAPVEPDPYSGRGFTVADLVEAAERQEVAFQEGDILIVHTGWVEGYSSAVSDIASTRWSGVEASAEVAEFLWDGGFSAIGSDNPAIENAPGDPQIGSLHRRMIPALGLPFFEMLSLRALVAWAHALGRWEFFFVSVPLHVRGAVSSPANAMVIL